MSKFISSWWTIEAAPGWLAEQDEKCISFFREDGVGSLQISAYKDDNATVTDYQLEEVLKEQCPNSAVIQKVRCDEFTGVEVDYIVEDRYWRKRLVTTGSLVIFSTYNSAAHDQAVEREAVDQMLASLKSRRTT